MWISYKEIFFCACGKGKVSQLRIYFSETHLSIGISNLEGIDFTDPFNLSNNSVIF